MRKVSLAAAAVALVTLLAAAASTINPTNQSAWGANIGWTNWRPTAADGVVVGEFVCSGYIWAANVGWINFGSGTPANNIQYENNSAADFGVNYRVDPLQPGVAILRGYAYGANIGWINFEPTGNPRLSLISGNFAGYAYSANCGWISLSEAFGRVQTDRVAMGVDTNNNGIADAWEYLYYGSLLAPGGQNADPFGTGRTNLQHYVDGTNPTQPNSTLRITNFATSPGGATSLLSWTSSTGRLYTIETATDLVQGNWTVDPNFGIGFVPDAGGITTRTLTQPSGPRRFFRVRSVRPLR
jgi:hypothetical protein